jgi:hypothetical protein
MKTQKVWPAFIAAISTALFIAAPANAAVVKNISTGINPVTGQQLANNAPDPDWTIAPGGDDATYNGQATIARSTPIPNVYQVDGASTASRWVVINSGAGLENFTVPGTRYNFKTTVDLTGFVPSTANIPAGHFAVDDSIIDIKINNSTVFTFPQNYPQNLDKFYNLPANFGQGFFTAGLNTIVFELNNLPSSPTALRLEANVEAAQTPEPSAMILFATFGTIALITRARYARN